MKTTLPILNKTQEEMVRDFQCPGCTNGINPIQCDSYNPEIEQDIHGKLQFSCKNHCAGTMLGRLGFVNLGLPKGFNRVVKPYIYGEKKSYSNIQFYEEIPVYNDLNMAVWAMELDGYLFVRVVCPRIDKMYVNVIKGGKFTDLPKYTANVSDFYDDID